MTKEELLTNVVLATKALAEAKNAIQAFEKKAENNRFETLEDAEATMHEAMDDEAFEDCEGAGNCGMESYSREVMVGEEKYRITAYYEYNRHDKTYYYIEERKYKTEKL